MIIEKFSKKRWKQKQSMVYGFIYEKKKNVMRNIFFNV